MVAVDHATRRSGTRAVQLGSYTSTGDVGDGPPARQPLPESSWRALESKTFAPDSQRCEPMGGHPELEDAPDRAERRPVFGDRRAHGRLTKRRAARQELQRVLDVDDWYVQGGGAARV